MEYVLLVYLNDILSGLEWLFEVVAVISLVGLLFLIFAWLEMRDEPDESFWVVFKKALKVLAVSTTLAILIPSEDSRKLMLAVYIGDQIVNTEEFQETTGKAYDLLQDWLDEALEEEK